MPEIKYSVCSHPFIRPIGKPDWQGIVMGGTNKGQVWDRQKGQDGMGSLTKCKDSEKPGFGGNFEKEFHPSHQIVLD